MDTLEQKGRKAIILLVEDNKGDVILTQRAFKEFKIDTQLIVASSGEEALSMLNREGDYKHSPLPDLILLDLNLPKMRGFDVLQKIKTTPEIKRIPVIILSSSKAENDVTQGYDLHSNAYIMKPLNMDHFNLAVRKIEEFWFNLALSPKSEPSA